MDASMDLPDLLTVEEAARVLRIGRTKAYALTRAWRDTDGEFGIPVIEIGGLRVPRVRLEELIDAPIRWVPSAPIETPINGVELRSIDNAQNVLPFSA